MSNFKECPICKSLMADQSFTDTSTKEYLKEHVCFNCGYTENLEEGEDDV